MRSYTVAGGGGIPLHVSEEGTAAVRSILFIHDFSHCCMAWHRQYYSNLAGDFRLVAMDLRGHGLSMKPAAAYDDSRLWADDVRAVIDTLGLERPVLVGWGYGALVVLDYLRHYSEEQVAGVHLVSPITSIGTPEATALFGDAFLDLVPRLYARDVVESVLAVEEFVRLMTHVDQGMAVVNCMLGYALRVPPTVREAILSRVERGDDLLRRLDVPVLIAQGVDDRVVQATAAVACHGLIPQARLSLYPEVGHAPFWEASERFNQELREFVEATE